MALILFVVGVLVSMFWGGFVTSTLWGWFLVPLGVKAITYWHAVGIGALVASFLGSRGYDTKDNGGSAAEAVNGGRCVERHRSTPPGQHGRHGC